MKMQYLLVFLTLLINAPLAAMKQARDIQATVEAVKKSFGLSPDRCHLAINKKTVFDINKSDLPLACLIAGYKDVYLTTVDSFHKMLPGLKSLLPELGIRQFSLNDEMILYSPKGQRFGLLLAKLSLVAALKAASFPVERKNDIDVHIIPFNDHPKEHNSYLIGTLLGYSESDITFYYAVTDFVREYTDAALLNAAQFPLWPEAVKAKFNNYESNIWPRSEDYQEYVDDKRIAHQWIIQHNHKTAAQLEQEIRNLQEQLFDLTKDNTTRWELAESEDESESESD